MQRITAPIRPLRANAFAARAKRTDHVSRPGPVERARLPKTDQVHFGKIKDITGPIPPKSLVILVPGMFSPEETMRPLAEYLAARGHKTHLLRSPYNIRGGSVLASTDWLTHGIDRIRLEEASDRYTQLLSDMEKVPETERVDFLCQRLKLKDNELGKAVAQAALGLMFTAKSNYTDMTDFTRIILRQRKLREESGGVLPAETARKQLYSLMVIARERLQKDLLPAFIKPRDTVTQESGALTVTLEKTLDHVIDQIAPRAVLVGHSMGGFVSMLTLFEQMHDTAMVVGLTAPGENGTEHIPAGFQKLPAIMQQKGRDLLDWFGSGLSHMLAGSTETMKLQADHQPFNTTIFAAGMPGEYDGLVHERNFRMNDALPGRINVVVTPRQANILEMVGQWIHKGHQFIRWNPLYAWAEDYFWNSSELVKGFAYHCGILQHHDSYWEQNGDLLRGILEAPKNPEGKPDYQTGTPDYEDAVKQLKRVIAPFNYEAERVHFLNVLQDTLTDAKRDKPPSEYQQLLKAYQPLRTDLEAICKEEQPIRDGVADKAEALLTQLNEVNKPKWNKLQWLLFLHFLALRKNNQSTNSPDSPIGKQSAQLRPLAPFPQPLESVKPSELVPKEAS
jgi:pimeloyl-ACP methyl ester carboxylesterase